MKKTFGILMICAALAVPAISFAGGQFTAYGQISKLESYGTGIRIWGLDLTVNPAGCEHTDFAMLKTTLTDPQANRINSVVTAAYLSGKDVGIKLHSSSCHEGRPVYYAVRFQ